jgi:hypothetical protein
MQMPLRQLPVFNSNQSQAFINAPINNQFNPITNVNYRYSIVQFNPITGVRQRFNQQPIQSNHQCQLPVISIQSQTFVNASINKQFIALTAITSTFNSINNSTLSLMPFTSATITDTTAFMRSVSDSRVQARLLLMQAPLTEHVYTGDEQR